MMLTFRSDLEWERESSTEVRIACGGRLSVGCVLWGV